MINKVTLSPCCFCGEQRFISIKCKTKKPPSSAEGIRYTYQVRCNNCFARGSVKYTEAEAISAWNGVER